MPHGNGADLEDLDVAALARQRATKIAAIARERGDDPGIEVGATALTEVALVRKHHHGVQTMLSNLYTQYGMVVGNTGKLADAATKGREELRGQMMSGFVRIETLIASHIERSERISGDLTQRLATFEKQERDDMANRRRSPEDSIVDVLERMDPEDAARIVDSRGRANAEAEEWRERFESVEKDLRERQIREDQEAKTKSEAEEDADKAFKKKKDLIAMIGGVLAILGAVGGVITYAVTHFK